MILFENRAAKVLYNILKVIKNKKFLLPLNICPIVPDTFIEANKEYEFCDISLDTLCMDEKLVLEKIKNDDTIDGILFVKTFGIEYNIQQFYQKIKEINKDIFIIDDMCPCIQEFNYDIENSYANVALFSSGYSKYVDIGYGGYGFLKDNDFKDIFKDKSNDKEFIKYKKTILEKIKLMKIHKDELNTIYKTHIPKKYHLGEKFNNWRFSILIDNKELILEDIFQIEGLFASSHYPQVDFEYLEYPMKNSNTQKIHKNIINLFNDFRFTKEKSYQIVDIINKYTQ
ncbi:MAG: DegT/DnrJ/EryC1/StrS aminotransferase family protein [Epsilonproteobacteria bacterium]|nr:MAG: DegT/DnrJ/EryC1/StrS aminotransferase family protein [Campylobacterota bacterium]